MKDIALLKICCKIGYGKGVKSYGKYYESIKGKNFEQGD